MFYTRLMTIRNRTQWQILVIEIKDKAFIKVGASKLLYQYHFYFSPKKYSIMP